MSYRDSRPRIRRHEGGTRDTLLIRRFRCDQCEHYHNELPDCLCPYKHYESETICGVLDGIISSDDTDVEDYPCSTTLERWRRWYSENASRMEGTLRNVAYRTLEYDSGALFTAESYLQKLKCQTEKWLEAVLRIIYNSGGRLCSIGF